VTEVGEAHHQAMPYAQGLMHDQHRLSGLLEGLTQKHVVEHAVGIVGESFIDVAVVDRKSLFDGGVDAFLRDLHSRAANLLLVDQHLEQGASSTAQVEHAGARLYDVHDEHVVEAFALRVAGDGVRRIRSRCRRVRETHLHPLRARRRRAVTSRKWLITCVCWSVSTKKASWPNEEWMST
jgi:hypothetical protein